MRAPVFALLFVGCAEKQDTCFVAGTQIRTPDGERAIESLRPGDLVLSWSVAERRLVPRAVTRIIRGTSDALFSVTAGDRVIAGVTASHPFFDAAAGAWRPLSALSARSRLLLVTGEGMVDPVPLTCQPVRSDGIVEVFNLSVEGEENYFAEGVLVHNKSPNETSYDSDPIADVTWGDDSLDLAITDNSTEVYFFGSAETDCSDSESCWYGEDCVFGDPSGKYRYCHVVTNDNLSLRYGGSYDDLQEGVETAYADRTVEGKVTFYLEDEVGRCWIWGHDVSYYADEGCSVMWAQ